MPNKLFDRSRFPAEAVSTSVVANLMGISPAQVRRIIKAGELRAYQFGREVRVRLDDLETFAESRRIRVDK